MIVHIVHIVFTSVLLVDMHLCIELFDEKAWMDLRGSDKYFEYPDLAARESATELNIGSNYSNNIDFEQFNERKTTKSPKKQQQQRNHGTQSPLNVIELLLKGVKRVISTPQPSSLQLAHHVRHNNRIRETSKGVDIAFDRNVHSLPAFGNHQDIKFIFLGTKWCGSGDVAKDGNDIGYFYMTDNCCREHDLCEHIIEPSGESFGLKNTGKFTRLHCDCDDRFYKCLKNVNSLVSKQIGVFYFNVLGHQCFREDFPVISCAASTKGRCIKWIKSENESRTFQWFDNKWF